MTWDIRTWKHFMPITALMRDGNLKSIFRPLLQEAARLYKAKHGCSATEAFVQIGKRVEYLKELAVGEPTFLEAKKQLEANANRGLQPA